ncbi:hypothetical protein ACFVH7_12420 [Kitasatospora indigofera]|uniref:hypothetical protein n=1 Tax=Kitasatospora indigofera TaxID=67307 RepID=UPI00363DE6D2
MPDHRPPQAVDLALDTVANAGRALAELREHIEVLTPEEAATVLHGLFLPPGPAHVLAGIVQSFGAWATDYGGPHLYEPLFRESAELTLGAYRVAEVANDLTDLGPAPTGGPRSTAARASSPAALAAGATTLRGPVEPATAADSPVQPPRSTEQPRR